jgi:hypothetical protein
MSAHHEAEEVVGRGGREIGMNRLNQVKRKFVWSQEVEDEDKKKRVKSSKNLNNEPRKGEWRDVAQVVTTQPDRKLSRVERTLERIERKLEEKSAVDERDIAGMARIHELMRKEIEGLLPGKKSWTPEDSVLARRRRKQGLGSMSDEQVVQYAMTVHTIARQASIGNYLSSLRAWLTFCHEHDHNWQKPTLMMMLGFAVYRFSGGLATSSLWKEYGKIRSLLGDMGLNMPVLKEVPLVVNVIKGMEIIEDLSGGKKMRYPCTTVHLRDCLETLSVAEGVSEDERVMFGAMWPVMLFGLLRIGEVVRKRKGGGWSTPLTWSDVKFYTCPRTQKQYVILHLPPSKTDKTGKKFRIVLEKLELKHAKICPVRALQRLRERLPSSCSDWEVFEDRIKGVKITYERFSKVLKHCLNAAGYDESRYHSHSWRIGGATVARAMGFTSEEIKALGRWMSDAYLVYTRPCLEHQGKLAARLQDWEYKLTFS